MGHGIEPTTAHAKKKIEGYGQAKTYQIMRTAKNAKTDMDAPSDLPALSDSIPMV